MSDAPDRKRFQLSWWALLPVILLIGANVVARPQGPRPDLAISQAMGGIVGGLLIATLFAWIASALSRHSRLVTTAVFTVFVMLAALGALAQLGNRGRDIERAKQAAAQVRQEMQAAQSAYEAAAKGYVNAGGLDAAALQSRASLDERAGQLQDVRDSLERLRVSIKGAPQRLEARLHEYRVPDEGIRAVGEDFRADLAQGKALESVVYEGRVVDVAREQFDLLRTHWGAWRYDAAGNQFEFDNSELLDRHAAVQAKIEKASAEQKEFMASRPSPPSR